MRRAVAGESRAEETAERGDRGGLRRHRSSSQERYVEMSAQEQVVLTVSVNGYGKRTSSYEYRTTGRGGKGIVAMSVNNRNGKLVASFPVEHSDQIMLVTDKGQLIRCPVEDIRIAGRSTQGVIVFDTAEDEHVVSVEHIGEEENGNGNAVANSRWQLAAFDLANALLAIRPPSVPARNQETLGGHPEGFDPEQPGSQKG